MDALRTESPPAVMPDHFPDHAMLLAAGLGTRMQPLTQKTPKPLVAVNGRTLLDRALDALEKAGVKKAVINIHYLAGQMRAHIRHERQKRPFDIVVMDESAELLDSAGGIANALPELGAKPFFVLNADTFWQDDKEANLVRLAQHFAPADMDMLLLTVARAQACGEERGDFLAAGDGRLARAAAGQEEAVLYGGALIVDPAVFAGAAATPHSLNLYFDRAIARGRLFGLPLAGKWYTAGTVAQVAAVEALLRQRGERAG